MGGVGGVVAFISHVSCIMRYEEKVYMSVQSSQPCLIRSNKDFGCDVERMGAIGAIKTFVVVNKGWVVSVVSVVSVVWGQSSHLCN